MIKFIFVLSIVLLSTPAWARSHMVCSPECVVVPFTSAEESGADVQEAAAAAQPAIDPRDTAISTAFAAPNSVLKALLMALNNGQLAGGQNLSAGQLKALIKSNM